MIIPPSSCVGICGNAQRQTIIDLILRLYDPQFGTILINDIDIKKYDVESLRSAMGSVSPDTSAIFNYSVLENIAMGLVKAKTSVIM